MNVLGLAATSTEYDAPRHPVASPCRVSLRLRGLVVDWKVRFWAKVDKSGGPGACWPWLASRTSQGYGRFSPVGNQAFQAHRLAYEMLVGPIPDGLVLDHLCRVRRCVNPTHLEPVTERENIRRGEGRTAVNARKTHCIHGHPFDAANTGLHRYAFGVVYRHCRTCKRERKAAVRAAQRRVALLAANPDCHLGDHDYSGAVCKWCGHLNAQLMAWFRFEKAEREGRAHDDHFHLTVEAKERCNHPALHLALDPATSEEGER